MTQARSRFEIFRNMKRKANVPTIQISSNKPSHPPSSAGPSAPGPRPRIHTTHGAVNMILMTEIHLNPRMYALISTSCRAPSASLPSATPVNCFSAGTESYNCRAASTFCGAKSSLDRSRIGFGTRTSAASRTPTTSADLSAKLVLLFACWYVYSHVRTKWMASALLDSVRKMQTATAVHQSQNLPKALPRRSNTSAANARLSNAPISAGWFADSPNGRSAIEEYPSAANPPMSPQNCRTIAPQLIAINSMTAEENLKRDCTSDFPAQKKTRYSTRRSEYSTLE